MLTTGECADILICVEEGTTTIDAVRKLFPLRVIVPVLSRNEKFERLTRGDCNAVAGDSTDILPSSVQDAGYLGPYELGQTRHTAEPLTPVTREDDPEWSDFVWWIVTSTFYAEEENITQSTGGTMPLLSLFGSSFVNAFRRAIEAVGNYGEIYERNMAQVLPRSGANLLNTAPNGPQQYVRSGL